MKTRARNRDSLSVSHSTYMYVSGHPLSPLERTFTQIPPVIDRMSDVVGNLGGHANPCTHYKIWSHLNTCDAVWNPYMDEPGKLITFPHGNGIQPPDPLYALQSISIPDLRKWLNSMDAKSIQKATEVVPDEYSLVNFLLDLISLCEGNITKLEGLASRITKGLDTFWGIVNRTGNYWLAWNYGIKPFLSDMKAILSSVNRAKRRIQWLREVNHTVVPIHYREGTREFEISQEFTPTIPKPVYSPAPPLEPHIEVLCRGDFIVRVRPNITHYVRFDIDDAYLADFGDIIVWLDMSGLYNPFNIVWDAIPFSFIVDWFRTVKQKCEFALQTDVSPFGQGTIVASCYSLKFNFVAYWTALLPDGSEQSLGNSQGKCYIRSPQSFTTEDAPFVLPLQWWNASILAALLQQKWRR